MDSGFKGNEPQPESPFGFETDRPVIDHGQPGVHVPPQMLTPVGHHVSGSGAQEPAIGELVKFTSKSNGKEYAALRTGDAWYITGKRGKFTWTEIVDEWAADPIFVMTPQVALHP